MIFSCKVEGLAFWRMGFGEQDLEYGVSGFPGDLEFRALHTSTIGLLADAGLKVWPPLPAPQSTKHSVKR